MKCVGIAAFLVAVFSFQQATAFGFAGIPGHPTTTPPPTGTCASRNYHNQCCPPTYNREADCGASDGNCKCDAQCHWYNDCCRDVYCTAAPMNCQALGLTTCCSDPNGYTPGMCQVQHPGTGNNYEPYCSCDVHCHQRNDCCSDAVSIGCAEPQTCAHAQKSAGCCSWSTSSSCKVTFTGGSCYCDAFCHGFNDCCIDVPRPQCPSGSTYGQSSRPTYVQSHRPPHIQSNVPPYSNRPSRVQSNHPAYVQSNRPTYVQSNRPSYIQSNRPSNTQSNRRLDQDLLALRAQQDPDMRPNTPYAESSNWESEHHRMAVESRMERVQQMKAKEFREKVRADAAAGRPSSMYYG